eukprot:scaffold1.g5580.t1
MRGAVQAVADAWRGMAPELAGLCLQVAATACVSVMGLLAKLVQGTGVPVFQVVLARSVVLLAFSVALLARDRANPFASARKRLLLFRGCLGFGAVSTIYGAVALLPLADAAVLAFLAPIFVALVSPCALGEPLSCGVAGALPLAAAGVVLVAQPTVLFGAPAGGGASAAPLSPWGVAGAKQHRARELAHLLTISYQLLGTWALKLCQAGPAVAMSYSSVLFGLAFDLAIFHSPPSGLALLGAALVCLSSAGVILDQRRVAAAARAAEQGGGAAGALPGQYELVGSAKAAAAAASAAEDGEAGAAAEGGWGGAAAAPPASPRAGAGWGTGAGRSAAAPAARSLQPAVQ